MNKKELLEAIKGKENGIPPKFSEIELNQAVDLVLFENYDIDKVCNMDSCELDKATYQDEYSCEDDENYYICPKCGEKIIIEYDGETYEGYTGYCIDCRTNFEISAYMMDNCQDELEGKNFDMHKYIQSYINSNY